MTSSITKPVFIVGCGRSGTTLLFDLMSQHPELARTTGYPDGEDHHGWITHGHCVMAGIGNVNSEKYSNGINGYHYCLHMTARDVTPEIITKMHAYYRDEVIGSGQGKRLLNKQPHLSNKLDYLLGIFPDARIIHIVRDCQATVASWIAVMQQHPSLVAYWPETRHPCFWLMPRPQDEVALAKLATDTRFFPGGGENLWIDYWRSINMGIEAQLAGRLGQLLTVRYEDLVSRPTEILGVIANFCELPDHVFDVGSIKTETDRKHTALVSETLARQIDTSANAARRHFGYLPRKFPWSKQASTLYRARPAPSSCDFPG